MVNTSRFGAAVPILRSFDEAKAKAFYVDFLGFEIGFEHRFEADMPLYMGLRRDGCDLHLSEHHGDCTPGARIRIPVSDLEGYAAALALSDYPHVRPGGPRREPWGELSLTVTDPFGNRVTFYETLP